MAIGPRSCPLTMFREDVPSRCSGGVLALRAEGPRFDLWLHLQVGLGKKTLVWIAASRVRCTKLDGPRLDGPSRQPSNIVGRFA